MEKQFTLDTLKASSYSQVRSSETVISGSVQPFISDFHLIEFKMEIKRTGKNSVATSTSVKLSGNYGGSELAQYLRAVNAAKAHVEALECTVQNLLDHSTATYAVTKALTDKDYDHALYLVDLCSLVNEKIIGTRSNWNYRHTNGRVDENLFDAIVFNESFAPVFEGAKEYVLLSSQEKYADISDEVETMYDICHTLIQKARMDEFGANEHNNTISVIELVREGLSVNTLKSSGENNDKLIALNKLNKEKLAS